MTLTNRASEHDPLVPVLTPVCDSDDTQSLDKDGISYKNFFYCCIPTSWIHSSTNDVDNSPSATVVLLLNNMIGSGILVQAYVFKESGIILVIIEYLIVGLMTYAGIELLIRSAGHVELYEYSELARRALGWPGAIAVDLSIATGMFGAILSYIIIIGSLCENILLTYVDAAWYTESSVWSFLLVGVFVLPISCIRNFGHLAYVSIGSIATIAGTLLLVLIFGAFDLVPNEGDKLNYVDFSGAMQMAGTVVFAFSYASAVFHAFDALKPAHRNPKVYSNVAQWTTFLGVLLSFVFGLIGYISFRSATEMDILENFSGVIGTFFKIIFVVHLVLYIPGDYVIMRYSYFKLCGANASNADDWAYFSSTFFALSLATLLSCVIQIYYSASYGLALVLGLTGGISNSIFGFIIPALIAIRLIPHQKVTFAIAILLLIFGICIPPLVLTSIIYLNKS